MNILRALHALRELHRSDLLPACFATGNAIFGLLIVGLGRLWCGRLCLLLLGALGVGGCGFTIGSAADARTLYLLSRDCSFAGTNSDSALRHGSVLWLLLFKTLSMSGCRLTPRNAVIVVSTRWCGCTLWWLMCHGGLVFHE